eukprot:6740978-Prymnesium_polylepis.1
MSARSPSTKYHRPSPHSLARPTCRARTTAKCPGRRRRTDGLRRRAAKRPAVNPASEARDGQARGSRTVGGLDGGCVCLTQKCCERRRSPGHPPVGCHRVDNTLRGVAQRAE